MLQVKRFFQIIKAIFLIAGLLRKAVKQGGDFSLVGKDINKIISDLGPTFIKLGQMLSLRSDLIPSSLADELRKLLDSGEEFSSPSITDVFKKELGFLPEKVFEHFEPKPFAIASLAQVHKAKYKGRTLAVKIQKPAIMEIIHQDLILVKIAFLFFPGLTKKLRKVKALLRTSLFEFFNWISQELDYRLEALNLSRVRTNFSGNNFFVVPEVFYQFSSKKVLAMEFIEGVSVNELFDNVKDLSIATTIQYKGIEFEKNDFIKKAIAIIFKQVFEDGYFHADPHPANILITGKGQLAYIDFGIVGVLEPRLRQKIMDLFLAIVDKDIAKITNSFVSLDEIQGHEDLPVIQRKIRGLLANFKTGTVLEITAAELFLKMINIALESGIDLPLAFVVLGKTILAYDGDIRKLDPAFDIIQAFKEQFEQRVGIMGFLKKMTPTSFQDFIQKSENLPQDLIGFLKKLSQEGVEFTVRFGPAQKSTPVPLSS